jgi:hypothetical protein
MANVKLIRELLLKMFGAPATKPSARKGSVGPGPTPTSFGDDPIDILDLDRIAIEEAETVTPKGLSRLDKERLKDKSNVSARGSKLRDDILKRRTVNEDFDAGPPNVFGEEDLSIQATREAISGPEDKVIRQSQKKFGSIEQPGAKDQLDDLFGEETTKQAGEIQDELDTDLFLQTLSPNLQKEIARDVLVPSTIRLKEIDQVAKKLFGGQGTPGQIPELSAALGGRDISREGFTISTTPSRVTTRAENVQTGAAANRLHEFRKLASQVTDAAREANQLRPDDAKVIATIKRMPENIRTQLRSEVKSGTPIAEALVELQARLLDRLN